MLVVIDSPDSYDSQINMLLPEGCSHPCTLVIIASRIKGVLMQRCGMVYQVNTLPDDLAMQLFAACAFPTGQPPEWLAEERVREVVAACAGLPLTLKVCCR